MTPADEARLVAAFKTWARAHVKRRRRPALEDAARFFLEVVSETRPQLCDWAACSAALQRAKAIAD